MEHAVCIQHQEWSPAADLCPYGAVKYDQDDVDFSKMGQLSDVLGLNPMEVGQVHTGLGEMAFTEQVKQVCVLSKPLSTRFWTLQSAPHTSMLLE